MIRNKLTAIMVIMAAVLGYYIGGWHAVKRLTAMDENQGLSEIGSYLMTHTLPGKRAKPQEKTTP